jgi:ABC-type Fe3+ transport system permease subunit
MEYFIIFVFFLVQMTIGVISYRRWTMQNSQLPVAKSQILGTVMDHYRQGTLEEYLEGIVYKKGLSLAHRNTLRQAIICAGALLLGIAFMFLVIKKLFPGSHIAFKIIITCIATTPFVFVAFAGIAQEFDDIRVMDFAKFLRDQLRQTGDGDNPERAIEDLLAKAREQR